MLLERTTGTFTFMRKNAVTRCVVVSLWSAAGFYEPQFRLNSANPLSLFGYKSPKEQQTRTVTYHLTTSPCTTKRNESIHLTFNLQFNEDALVTWFDSESANTSGRRRTTTSRTPVLLLSFDATTSLLSMVKGYDDRGQCRV